jgi:hypothetical protein
LINDRNKSYGDKYSNISNNSSVEKDSRDEIISEKYQIEITITKYVLINRKYPILEMIARIRKYSDTYYLSLSVYIALVLSVTNLEKIDRKK